MNSSSEDSSDYDSDGGEWIGGEFVSNKRKRRRTHTKQDAWLGSMGVPDTRRQGQQQQSSNGGGGRRGKKSLLSGINFKAGGSLKPKDFEPDEMQQDNPVDDDVEMSSAPRGGLGSSSFGSSRPGLGQGMGSFGRAGLGASADNGDEARPSFGGGQNMFKAFLAQGEKDSKEKQATAATEDLASRSKLGQKILGASSSSSSSSSAPVKKMPKPKYDQGFAKFANHTRGFGMKYMKSFGFKGRLGAEEQGRANPILPNLRPQGAGIGMVKEYRADLEEIKHQEAEEKGLVDENKVWKKTPASSSSSSSSSSQQRKLKKQYKTAREVLREKRGGDDAMPHVRQARVDTIVDYTKAGAPTTRDVSSIVQESSTPTGDARQNARKLPEFQHNLRLLVDLTELDIHKIDAEIHTQKNIIAKQAREQKASGRDHEAEQAQITRLEHILDMIDYCISRLHIKSEYKGTRNYAKQLADPQKPLDLAALADMFRELQTDFKSEYSHFELQFLAIPAVFPLIKKALLGWRPLTQPDKPLAILETWHALLSSPSHSQRDVFAELFDTLILPSVRTAIVQWQVLQDTQHQTAVALLTGLRRFFPHATWKRFLRDNLIPKMARTADQWSAARGPPAHAWLHPWLPLCADELAVDVFPKVRRKLVEMLRKPGAVLSASDPTGFALVSPWQRVLSRRDWQTLTSQAVLPRLHAFLRQNLRIDPANQSLAEFHEAARWAPLLDANLAMELFEQRFFPDWLSALYSWLSSSSCEFGELGRWYSGWKSLVPRVLIDHPRIQEQLSLGLDLINCRLRHHKLPKLDFVVRESGRAAERIAEMLMQRRARQRRHKEQQKRTNKQVPRRASDATQMSLRTTLEKIAAMQNLSFVPAFARGRHNGNQIYHFGAKPVAIFIRDNCIFIENKSQQEWAPIGVDALLEQAQ